MRTRTWSCTSATIKTALKLHGTTEPETSGYVFSLFDVCKKLPLKFYLQKHAALKLY